MDRNFVGFKDVVFGIYLCLIYFYINDFKRVIDYCLFFNKDLLELIKLKDIIDKELFVVDVFVVVI